MTKYFLSLLLLLPAIGFASPALVQEKGTAGACRTTGTPVASKTCQFDSTVTAGNVIIVAIGSYNFNDAITFGVTDNCGNTYAEKIYKSQTNAPKNISAIWYAYNVSGGSACTITVEPSASDFIGIHVSEWSGLTTTDPGDAEGDAAPETASNPAAVTTGTGLAQANELVIANFVFAVSASHTAGDSCTLGAHEDTLGGDVLEMATLYKTVNSGTGAQTCSDTTDVEPSTGYAVVIATFKAAGAAAVTRRRIIN